MSNRVSSFPAERAARPWYRQLWPWLLIAGPALVVVASVTSACLAIATDDGVVAEDYYKRGLLINRQLAADSASAPEPSAVVAVAADGRVDVRMSYRGAAPNRVRLTLRHPGDREQVLALVPAGDGVWTGTMGAQTPGRWIVALETDLWRLPVTTVQGRLGEIRLGAERASF